MKNLSKIMFWMAILPLLFVMSCKDDDPAPADDNFGKLSTYLIDNNLDLDNVLTDWIVAAPATVAEVDAFLSPYHVFDIRSATDFAAGHVSGAVNTTLGTIVADAASVTKPILVVCYTGQTASHAAVALRLSGHPTAKVLKWGMSGWNSANDKWSPNIGSIAVGNNNWTMDATAPLVEYEYPTFESTATGAELLAERVSAMTAKGFQGVNGSDVLAAPTTFNINNFWAQADVDHYGHFVSAVRNQPMTLKAQSIKFNDPSKTVVTYCWTGQTSSMVTAYLTVLGYDAKSLKFGANNLIFSELESHKFAPPSVDLPVVTD